MKVFGGLSLARGDNDLNQGSSKESWEFERLVRLGIFGTGVRLDSSWNLDSKNLFDPPIRSRWLPIVTTLINRVKSSVHSLRAEGEIRLSELRRLENVAHQACEIRSRESSFALVKNQRARRYTLMFGKGLIASANSLAYSAGERGVPCLRADMGGIGEGADLGIEAPGASVGSGGGRKEGGKEG